MPHAILFDCEFLSAEDAPRRYWCGPYDPDPTVVQIGAVRLNLTPPFAIASTFQTLIRPTNRLGAPVTPDPAVPPPNWPQAKALPKPSPISPLSAATPASGPGARTS